VLRIALAGALGLPLVSALALGIWEVDLLRHLHLFPACPFRGATGIPCPGCGMTRALLLLGQLRVGEAWLAQPLAPGLLLAMLWALLGAPGRGRIPREAAAGLALAAVLGVWLMRL
jgi:hypothetical protein